jgi:hypothetical protein
MTEALAGIREQTCACAGGAGGITASVGRPGVPAATRLRGTSCFFGIQQPLHPRRERRVARPIAARIMCIGALLQHEQPMQRAYPSF